MTTPQTQKHAELRRWDAYREGGGGWIVAPITQRVSEEDARLIASAPDLLLQRDALLSALEELVEAIWDGRLEHEGAEVFTDPARAAIALARGTKEAE